MSNSNVNSFFSSEYMVGGASASGASGNVAGVRIVVAGDAKTGKSSLIATAATENYPNNVPPLLPPTRLPEDVYPDRVPVTVIDTSSRSASSLSFSLMYIYVCLCALILMCEYL